MPQYQYRALHADGKVGEGVLDAPDRQHALREMEGRGLRTIALSEKGGAGPKVNGKAAGEPRGASRPASEGLRLGGNKITARILENFTRLLSSLLAAGVPLSRALVILYREAATPLAGAKWREIHDRVIDGMSLADAMALSPETFPRVYTAMVQAGETGGFLDLVLAQFAMARFCRMLGTLLGAGVPLVQGLNVARKSIGNQILVDAVSNSIERVKEGAQLAKSLADCRDLFSGSTLEMISVAEESGKLDQELVRIANVTEGDLDRQLKTAVAFAEPLMLFLIAGFIGVIFIGMVVPIFSLQEHVK